MTTKNSLPFIQCIYPHQESRCANKLSARNFTTWLLSWCGEKWRFITTKHQQVDVFARPWRRRIDEMRRPPSWSNCISDHFSHTPAGNDNIKDSLSPAWDHARQNNGDESLARHTLPISDKIYFVLLPRASFLFPIFVCVWHGQGERMIILESNHVAPCWSRLSEWMHSPVAAALNGKARHK